MAIKQELMEPGSVKPPKDIEGEQIKLLPNLLVHQ